MHSFIFFIFFGQINKFQKKNIIENINNNLNKISKKLNCKILKNL